VDNIVLRGLSRDDFGKGMMELLGQLTDSSGVSSEDFAKRADELIQDSRTHVVVAEDTATGRVVGTAKLLVELKFTRQLGKCGHIEDVVVDTNVRGKQLGKRVVQECVRIAKEEGCYKVILDCADNNVAFYEKVGFKPKERQMALYLMSKT
jgi:glucosamine-phosphate N-acetyltransferase